MIVTWLFVNPYTISRCNKILLGTWIDVFLHSIIQVALVVQLPSCGPNEIGHYFCDVHPVLKLTCTDTYVVGVVVTANSGTFALGSFVILLISYTIILVSPRKQSAEGRCKALSTCGSHITVVIFFLVPVLSCISILILPFHRLRWWLCFIPSSPPCSTPWFIHWEMQK